jgi:hypothetical protein
MIEVTVPCDEALLRKLIAGDVAGRSTFRRSLPVQLGHPIVD